MMAEGSSMPACPMAFAPRHPKPAAPNPLPRKRTKASQQPTNAHTKHCIHPPQNFRNGCCASSQAMKTRHATGIQSDNGSGAHALCAASTPGFLRRLMGSQGAHVRGKMSD